jgi:hypothetical protein
MGADKTLEELRAMPLDELVRELFDNATTTVTAAADLTPYRAMSVEELFNALASDDLTVTGSCKQVLLERMAAAGIDDIVHFIGLDWEAHRN